jgi:hypothetical protein
VFALGLGQAGEDREQGGAVPGQVVHPVEGPVRRWRCCPGAA